jgi:hypothetical protein
MWSKGCFLWHALNFPKVLKLLESLLEIVIQSVEIIKKSRKDPGLFIFKITRGNLI